MKQLLDEMKAEAERFAEPHSGITKRQAVDGILRLIGALELAISQRNEYIESHDSFPPEAIGICDDGLSAILSGEVSE